MSANKPSGDGDASSAEQGSLEIPEFLSLNKMSPPQRNLFTTSVFYNSRIAGDWVPASDVDSPRVPMYLPLPTENGALAVRLRDNIQVDMTIDGAVWVTNFTHNIMVLVDATASSCALMHPQGRIFQYNGQRVEVLVHDGEDNKYAMISPEGIVFTSCLCPLVFKMDSSGVRTTGCDESCSDLSKDFAVSLFYMGSRHGQTFVTEATELAQTCLCHEGEDGSYNWHINNIRISQSQDGTVKVTDMTNFSMATSMKNGSTVITTNQVHGMASIGEEPLLFARQGDGRVLVDSEGGFSVRLGDQKAGIDENNALRLF